MFIERIFIYPTTDIHLLMAGPDMKVEVLGFDILDNLVDVTGSPTTSFMNFDPAVTVINSAGKFKPVGVGSTIGRIVHNDITDPSDITTSEVLVRVFVHDAIEQFWIGNNRVTIREGENNYVLSIFAKFTDGTFGDISSHPYLNFSSSDTSFISVDNANDKGRLKGIKASPAVALTVTHNGLSDTINGFVLPPIEKNTRPILKRIHGGGNFKDKRNILFLSEGFINSQQDKDLFDRVVQEITNHMFDTPLHSPYDMLKDKFNVWVAFEPSNESGLTILNPINNEGTIIPSGHPGKDLCSDATISLESLIEFVGLPDANSPGTLVSAKAKWATIAGLNLAKVNEELFDLWKELFIGGFLQAKDSFFGLAIGGRFAERASANQITPLGKRNKWNVPSVPARVIIPDLRRCNKDRKKTTDFISKYLRTLRYGTNASDPNFDVFKSWSEETSKDIGLVCIIANDLAYAGVNFPPIAFSLGQHYKIPVFKVGAHPFKMDHVSTFQSISLDIGQLDPIRLSHKAAHEIAHSMQLGDEYEAYDDPAQSQFTDTILNLVYFAMNANLAHSFELVNTATNKIEADRIKWNWHRIKQAGILITAAADSGSDKVNIRLKSGEGAKWQHVKSANEKVFLRIPQMNADGDDRALGIDGPFTISNITAGASGDLIELKGRTRPVDPDVYPKGSILFLPLKDTAGNLLMTIHPSIISHINTTGEPFHKNTNCANCHDGPSFPPNNIANFNYPVNRFEVIGLYEGGGHFNCKAFRPTGMCQMRDLRFMLTKVQRTATFSLIAKYIIVNHIDPVQLPRLNPLFP